jgi:hypothetical protein
LILSFFLSEGFAQEENTKKNKPNYTGILTGYTQGHYGFGEIGYFSTVVSDERHWGFASEYISSEIKIDPELLMGFKIGITGAAMGPTPIGLNLIYYTDFNRACLVFRPEFGFGMESIRLVYGYNARIINRTFDLINKHQVVLLYSVNLKKQ